MSCGRTGTRFTARPVAAAMASTMAGVTEMHGGSPTPLAPSGRLRVGLLDEGGDDVGGVEERRQQVVGERRVPDAPVRRCTISSITARPRPWAMPPSIWPIDRQRVEGPADVLGGGDLHDLHQAELEVDVDDGPMGDEGERRVAVALAVLVELLGGPVVVLDGLLERAGRRWPRPPGTRRSPNVSTTSVPSTTRRSGSSPWWPADVLEELLAHGPAGGVDRTARHPRLARRRRGPGRADRGVHRLEHAPRRRRARCGRSAGRS